VTAKYRSESKYQSTEIGLKPENLPVIVRASIYNIENRLQNVTKRINSSPRISPRNKELIWKFAEHCKIQGLSVLRVIFYLNRFYNIGRVASKDFDQMEKRDVEQLVLGVRSLSKNGEPLSERTILDHMTAIKTFWRWLKETDDETPPEVKWIRTAPSKRASKLPDELPNPDDIQQLISATNNARDKALVSSSLIQGAE